MKPKERVYAALRREPADRIPIFMWFHPEMQTLLSELFEVPPETPIENIFAMYQEAGITREQAFDRAADIRALLEV